MRPVQETADVTGCPHPDIRFCPLYIAAHIADEGYHGCDDGRLDEGGCAVDRTMNYAEAVERLRIVDPRLVATLAFLEEAEEARQQRNRNMRAAGIQ